jgi:Tol biopolymer transport system component
MKRQSSLSVLALLAAAAAAPGAAAPLPQASPPNASILFARATFEPRTGNTLQSALFRIRPTNRKVVPLTPQTEGARYLPGSWSPSGSSIAYTYFTPTTYAQIAVVDRQGGSARRITAGPGPYGQPVWGPHGTIAFISDRSTEGVPGSDEGCLSVVKASGVGQHVLFCPPFRGDLRPFLFTSRPQWSADGKNIYIDVEALEAGLEPTFGDSRIYRVNARTGAATKITEQKFDSTTTVSIAPDGRHAVYALTGANAPLVVVNLLNGARRTLGATGAEARYSRDGCRIAFVRRESVINTQSFGTVYVMNADGSHVHRAIRHPDPDATYAIADWSPDGKRLLVNKAVGDQVNDQVLQIVNLASGKASRLTRGTAGEGAWYGP